MTDGAKIIVKSGSSPARALRFDAAIVADGLRVEGVCSAELVRTTSTAPQLTNLYLDGKTGAHFGLYMQDPGAANVISPTIRNIGTPPAGSSTAGIVATGSIDGVTIVNPDISDISAPTSGAMGDAYGSCRGIVFLTSLTAGEVKVSGGKIARISGREGDCIQALSSSPTYYADKFTLRVIDTLFEDFNRRAVKGQVGITKVKRITTRFRSYVLANVPFGICAVDCFGATADVSDCDIDARYLDFGITSSNGIDGRISGNKIVMSRKQASDGDWTGRSVQTGIYITGSSNIEVGQNELHAPVIGIRFSGSNRKNSAIGNKIHGARGSGGEIWIDSTSVGTVVVGNRAYDEDSATAQLGIWDKGTGSYIADNTKELTNTTLYSAQVVTLDVASTKATVARNWSNGDGSVVVSASTTARIYGNGNRGTGGVGPQAVQTIGDAAATAQSGPIQAVIYSAPITADRTVTTSTYPVGGDVLRVSRTAAATGAFNVIVGSSLKSLTAGQWVEATYNGTAWVISAGGSL